MNYIPIVFTIEEVVRQIRHDLTALPVDTTAITLEQFTQYIIARAIEDILLVDLTEKEYTSQLEHVYNIIGSNYRRVVGDNILTIHEDVGTNNSFSTLRSTDLSFGSQLKLHRYCVIIRSRD